MFFFAQDYYLYAAHNVQLIIDKENNNILNNIKITRKMIKKTVMTIPYNITFFLVVLKVN
jgi:hypothetical protein